MKNRFEQYPIFTGVFLFLLVIIITLLSLEAVARFGLDLGKVVLYDSHPIYGFRPQANQHIARRGHIVDLNAEGLRAHPDWAKTDPQKRILFLGDSVTYGGSYINNEALFSRHIATQLSLVDGNAGVNAWGVLNIHALITEMSFLPAATYVTVLPEGDFYRGLNRIGGQPFWTRQPKYALEEILYYIIYKLNLSMNGSFNPQALPIIEQRQIANIAAKKLKEMHDLIISKGYKHYIFITPNKQQVINQAPIDLIVQDALKINKVDAHYLLEDIKKQTDIHLNADLLYYDIIHLTAAGHALWGDIIAQRVNK